MEMPHRAFVGKIDFWIQAGGVFQNIGIIPMPNAIDARAQPVNSRAREQSAKFWQRGGGIGSG
jgi:hypothetical protein